MHIAGADVLLVTIANMNTNRKEFLMQEGALVIKDHGNNAQVHLRVTGKIYVGKFRVIYCRRC